MNESKKILIIGPSWVGDMVMAQTLFMVIKQQDPTVTIDVLAPAWSEPLLATMGEVNRAIALPIGHGEIKLGIRREVAQSLKLEQYDQAIVIPRAMKAALIPLFARIPQRTGWLGEYRYGLLNDIRHLNKTKMPLMIERLMALGLPKDTPIPKPYPQPQLQINPNERLRTQKKFNINQNRFIALCPGAEYGPAKRWPAKHFTTVANELQQQDYEIFLMGSKNDIPMAQQIQNNCRKPCHDFTGKTSLKEAIEILSMASAVVSNDSGLMHIAAALNIPVIALYGSSDPHYTPPLNPSAKVLRLGLPCSPCFKRECPLGHTNCLENLTPQSVLQALEEHVQHE